MALFILQTKCHIELQLHWEEQAPTVDLFRTEED